MLTVNADNLNRFMRCQGSRLLAVSTVESAPNPARDEGIAAHWAACEVFNGRHTLVELIDRKAPNGVYISAEMAEHVSDYLHTIVDRKTNFAGMEIDTSWVGQTWQVNGRADHISLSADGNILHVDDFKYGWRIVEPEENWTLIWHAVGWIMQKQSAVPNIVFTIHQPRPHHHDGKRREWRMGIRELYGLQESLFRALENPSDMLNTGEHCGKCPSLETCPAAQKAAMNAVDISELAFNDEMNNAQLSHELDTLNRASKAIENRLKACEELAKHRIKQGAIVENYTLQESLSNRNWKPGTTPELLQTLTGIDVAERKLPTPKQAEVKGISPEIVAAFCERKSTGTRLTRANADTTAKRIFGEK